MRLINSTVKVLLMLSMVLAMSATAMAKTTIIMEYPYPDLFDKVHGPILEQFKAVEPDIEVKVRTKYQSYEDGTKTMLRSAMTNSLPDVTFQGISSVRVMKDKGIAQPLDAFIAQEKDFGASGFNDAMYQTCRFDDKVYGLPFAVSLPITYYNMTLARKAGYTEETLPKTWDEVYEYARKVEAATGEGGFFYNWCESGFWQLQALVFADGGSFMDAGEKKVLLDSPTGIKALQTLRDMVARGHMRQDYRWNTGSTDFYAGKLGLLVATSSILQNVKKSIGGRFELKTHFFPGLREGSRLPVGGNAAIMVARDPEKQRAVWKFIKFWCGVEGATVMASNTGYMAPNKNAAAALKASLEKDPNQMTVYRQQPFMAGWYAFPGKNGLKITEVIYNAMEKVITTDASPKEVASDVNKRVQRLVP